MSAANVGTFRSFELDGVRYGARIDERGDDWSDDWCGGEGGPSVGTNESVAFVWALSEDLSARQRVLSAAVLALRLPEALASADWDPKAGCACGCSPGFVLRGFKPAGCVVDLFIGYDVRPLEGDE